MVDTNLRTTSFSCLHFCSKIPVKVWDAVTGHTLLTYRGHTFRGWGLAWSPDGTRLASGSDDQTAQVWEATTGRTLLTYRQDDQVEQVAWSPDGRRIASACQDGTV